MKKALIIGGCLFLIGLILIGVSFVKVGFDFRQLVKGYEVTESIYLIEDNIESITITGIETDITLLPSQDNTCQIISHDSKSLVNTFVLNSGILTVDQTDNRAWYEYIFNLGKNTDISIYLPVKAYEKLTLATGSGNVITSEALSFGKVKIETKSGNISFLSTATESLTVTASSGNIEAKGKGTDIVELSTRSGEIDLDCADGEEIIAESSSGDVTAKWKNVKFIDLISNSGSIEVDGFDGKEIRIKNNSGDVDGRIFGDITYEAESRSGYITIPKSKNGGKCIIKTQSGDINIE